MNNDELTKITDSIKEKIGEDLTSTIADDLGLLITANNQVLKELEEKEKKISRLEDDKEKLVVANGNLLQQIPMGEETPKEKEEKEKPVFNLNDMFDERGNFKRKL